jgi:hypothetical protein
VPEICSCGAQLVADARFCHRCGKPVGEVTTPTPSAAPVELASSEEALPLPTVLPEQIGDISFANSSAVRVGLFVAALAMLIFVPLSQAAGLSLPGVFGLTLASGLLAVFLYQRRTGVSLSARQGARLGWMTGVFMFAFFLVLFTVSLIPALESGEFSRIPDEALRGKLSATDLEKVKEVLSNPWLFSLSILFFMAIYFIAATILTSLGGILGARFLGRDPRLQR